MLSLPFARFGREDFRGAPFPHGNERSVVFTLLVARAEATPSQAIGQNKFHHKSALLFLNFGLAESLGFSEARRFNGGMMS
jgi:hypothetical protein